MENNIPKYLDKSLPKEERQKEYKKAIEKMVNPFDTFDPDNFEPSATEDEKVFLYRKRVLPPKELPTYGLKPREIVIGQMIGMYENGQDLYLIFAHRINELQAEIDLLKDKIKQLEK